MIFKKLTFILVSHFKYFFFFKQKRLTYIEYKKANLQGQVRETGWYPLTKPESQDIATSKKYKKNIKTLLKESKQHTQVLSYTKGYMLASDNLPSRTLLLLKLHGEGSELLQNGIYFAHSKWTTSP